MRLTTIKVTLFLALAAAVFAAPNAATAEPAPVAAVDSIETEVIDVSPDAAPAGSPETEVIEVSPDDAQADPLQTEVIDVSPDAGETELAPNADSDAAAEPAPVVAHNATLVELLLLVEVAKMMGVETVKNANLTETNLIAKRSLYYQNYDGVTDDQKKEEFSDCTGEKIEVINVVECVINGTMLVPWGVEVVIVAISSEWDTTNGR
jgi:hypothetical protein